MNSLTGAEKPFPQEKENRSIPQWRSEELFKGHREIVIEHVGTLYRLMVTKTGKLILNK